MSWCKTNQVRKLRHRALMYADVNASRPAEYWNYDALNIQWGNIDHYQVIGRIGRGRYSEVFEGLNVLTGARCVIKVLKPSRSRKVRREVKILQNLFGGTNIIKLYDVVHDPATNTPSLIFESINGTDLRALYPGLTAPQVKHYMFQLLQALHCAHRNGIMHRDLKPYNIVVDQDLQILRLIDWGLADFYHPNQDYNVHIASRFFKGPELFVQMRDYDYSLDLWGFGCILAGIVFRREPFFRGDNNRDQLIKIVQVLGVDDFFRWVDKYGLEVGAYYTAHFAERPYYRVELRSLVNTANEALAGDDDAIDLISRLLRYDPAERITAKDAMAHPYFKGCADPAG